VHAHEGVVAAVELVEELLGLVEVEVAVLARVDLRAV
jgi:hypothetical protein